MTPITTVPQLRAGYKRLRRMHLVSLILAVLALVTFFIEPWITLAVLAVSVLFNVLCVRKATRVYTKGFTHMAAELSIRRHLAGGTHSHEPLLTEAAIREPRMLPCNAATGGVACREGGQGLYRGRPVTLGDVTLAHTFTEGTKKRHNFTVGCWMEMELEQDTGLDCRFIGENIIPAQSLTEMLWVESDLKQVPVAAPLTFVWRILCPEDQTDLPPVPFLKQLDRLHKATDGHVAVCLRGDRLYVMLVGQIMGQTVSGRIGPGPHFEEADLLSGLPGALKLSDCLK